MANGFTDEGALADRQWMTFVDPDTVLLIYNQQQPRNVVVQRSDDSGLTYGPMAVLAARNPRFPGPIRYIEPTSGLPNGLVYFPWDRAAPNGNQINISFSTDRGATWRNCGRGRTGNDHPLRYRRPRLGREHLHRVRREREVPHVPDLDERCEAHRGKSGVSRPDGLDRLPPLRADLFGAPVQVDRDGVRSTVSSG